MAKELTLAEMETALSMSADDRGTWQIFSDDKIMQSRLEAIGATLVRQSADGISKWYTLPANQVTFRQAPKPLSNERKAQLAAQLAARRAESVATGAKTLETNVVNS